MQIGIPMFTLALSFTFLSLCLGAASEASEEPHGVHVLSVSPIDGRAVARVNDGELTVYGVGDALIEDNYVIKKILSDRIVVEENAVPEKGQPKTVVWIFVADANGVSRVQRLEQTSRQME